MLSFAGLDIGFEQGLWLFALPLAVIPMARGLILTSGHAHLALMPQDTLSSVIAIGLRLSGGLAAFFLVLALSGLYVKGGEVLRHGVGSNIVLLIDRSSSMDNTFANRRPDGGEESKAAAAKRLLLDFLNRSAEDRIGVAAFSTSPMLDVPMTEHLDILRAAVSGMDEPGLSQTDVGRGLSLALSMFENVGPDQSRALLLVSDGAGLIAREVQEQLKAQALEQRVNLYWLYLRTAGAHGIFEPVPSDQMDIPQLWPERHLHLFLQTLGVPYRAFEAESADAVAEAISEISKLEARPLVYAEPVPRQPLAPLLYALSAIAILPLVLFRLIERPFSKRRSGALVRTEVAREV